MELKSLEINTIMLSINLNKRDMNTQWGKPSSINDSGKTGQELAKETGLLSHATYTK